MKAHHYLAAVSKNVLAFSLLFSYPLFAEEAIQQSLSSSESTSITSENCDNLITLLLPIFQLILVWSFLFRKKARVTSL